MKTSPITEVAVKPCNIIIQLIIQASDIKSIYNGFTNAVKGNVAAWNLTHHLWQGWPAGVLQDFIVMPDSTIVHVKWAAELVHIRNPTHVYIDRTYTPTHPGLESVQPYHLSHYLHTSTACLEYIAKLTYLVKVARSEGTCQECHKFLMCLVPLSKVEKIYNQLRACPICGWASTSIHMHVMVKSCCTCAGSVCIHMTIRKHNLNYAYILNAILHACVGYIYQLQLQPAETVVICNIMCSIPQFCELSI